MSSAFHAQHTSTQPSGLKRSAKVSPISASGGPAHASVSNERSSSRGPLPLCRGGAARQCEAPKAPAHVAPAVGWRYRTTDCLQEGCWRSRRPCGVTARAAPRCAPGPVLGPSHPVCAPPRAVGGPPAAPSNPAHALRSSPHTVICSVPCSPCRSSCRHCISALAANRTAPPALAPKTCSPQGCCWGSAVTPACVRKPLTVRP